ncbi:hypothetical protein OH809_38320 [Streptomyces sp. NBC_00873]|nr:hypothetical protein OH809_38320 [Streptomyces sp. NBC_00873]WTA42118.1 hypothetical protein OH821_05390 [Streptomyces sp. NBC_00842]
MRPLRLLFLGALAVAVGLATIVMAANPTTAQTAPNPKPQTIPAQ